MNLEFYVILSISDHTGLIRHFTYRAVHHFINWLDIVRLRPFLQSNIVNH